MLFINFNTNFEDALSMFVSMFSSILIYSFHYLSTLFGQRSTRLNKSKSTVKKYVPIIPQIG